MTFNNTAMLFFSFFSLFLDMSGDHCNRGGKRFWLGDQTQPWGKLQAARKRNRIHHQFMLTHTKQATFHRHEIQPTLQRDYHLYISMYDNDWVDITEKKKAPHTVPHTGMKYWYILQYYSAIMVLGIIYFFYYRLIFISYIHSLSLY